MSEQYFLNFLKYQFFVLDIAIGAPYEENGVVYIYSGRQSGIIGEPSQVRIVSFEPNVDQRSLYNSK